LKIKVTGQSSRPLKDKNSSGDEIANVNIFTTISHTYFKIPKKENLLRLTNETIAGQLLRISFEFMNLLQNFHLAVI